MVFFNKLISLKGNADTHFSNFIHCNNNLHGMYLALPYEEKESSSLLICGIFHLCMEKTSLLPTFVTSLANIQVRLVHISKPLFLFFPHTAKYRRYFSGKR